MATDLKQPPTPEFKDFKAADEKAPGTYVEDSVVKPMILSHGTLGCVNLEESAKFYREFLGLDCVRHGDNSMNVRKGGYWAVVCLEIGERTADLKTYNHWGIDVATPEEVEEAHEAALKYKDRYGIRRINKVYEQHGDWAFKLQDRDGNWWEIQYIREPMKYDKRFARGNVATGSGTRSKKPSED